MTGTIKRLVAERGFGFIEGQDGMEYFFHRTAVDGSFEDLREGDAVELDAEATAPKGPRAAHVALAEAGLRSG